jgi:hypothetical protein
MKRDRVLWLSALVLLCGSQQLLAGASCVVAKRLGNSLAIEWSAGEILSPESATEKAKQKLLAQGLQKKYQDLHPQATSDLPHAHMVIVKTEYQTLIGKQRTSYGCGYSRRSAAEAEQAALYDLQNYSWGWKPEFGYKLVKAFRY